MSEIPDELRADAVDMIRKLCGVAGDEREVLTLLGRYLNALGNEANSRTVLAALAVVFTECITTPAPIDPSAPVPVTIP